LFFPQSQESQSKTVLACISKNGSAAQNTGVTVSAGFFDYLPQLFMGKNTILFLPSSFLFLE